MSTLAFPTLAVARADLEAFAIEIKDEVISILRSAHIKGLYIPGPPLFLHLAFVHHHKRTSRREHFELDFARLSTKAQYLDYVMKTQGDPDIWACKFLLLSRLAAFD